MRTIQAKGNRIERTQCRNCGAYGYPDDKFCPNCGTGFGKQCTSCSYMSYHPVARYCAGCGTRFETPTGTKVRK